MLLQDFITAFRPHTIEKRTRPMLCEWRELLIHCGIYINPDRTRRMVDSIIYILYREDHIGSDNTRRPRPKEANFTAQTSTEGPTGSDHNPNKKGKENSASHQEEHPEGGTPPTKANPSTNRVNEDNDPDDSSDGDWSSSDINNRDARGNEKE